MNFTVMNGWKDAPHCWKRYLTTLPSIRKYPNPKEYNGTWELSVLGFVIFISI